jgi:riboflavin kinase/FMN adenylyltransferase
MAAATTPIALAIGFFDGVHLGHQAILGRGREAAAACGGHLWVLTFDAHPRRVLKTRPPPLLTSNRHKLILLRRYGADGCLLLPFTPAFAETEPEAFVRDLRRHAPALAAITVGSDWRFGRAGCGSVATLARECQGSGVAIVPVEAVCADGAAVSSTRIRQAVAAGRLDTARALLGRPFSLLGTVVHGHAAGRELGFRTANLACDAEAVPPQGVYAVYAAMDRGIREGVLSYGTRQTLHGDPAAPVLELHLPGFDGDLYGRDIEVFLVAGLREQRRFPAVEELRAQIRADIRQAGSTLSDSPLKEWLYTHCFGVL